MLWRAGGWVEPWGSLRATAQVRRKTSGLLRLLRRRRQTWAALVVAGHDAAEQIARPVSNRWRRRLRGAMVLRVLAGATAGLEFALQTGDLLLVPATACQCPSSEDRCWDGLVSPCGEDMARLCNKAAISPVGGNSLRLDLDVLLLQGVDLAADHLNLLDMALNCSMTWLASFHFVRASTPVGDATVRST